MHGLNNGTRSMFQVVVLVSALAVLAGCAVRGTVLTETLAEPLNAVKTLRVDINAGYSNLTVDHLTGGEPLLAGGSLEYLENQGMPLHPVTILGDAAELSLRATNTTQSGLLLPWQACVASLAWQVHLHPGVTADITAYSDGGNITMNLASLPVARVAAETGGGNVTIDLGELDAGSISINAESGAGNVQVSLPVGIAARIHATTGAGKVTVDTRFSQVGNDTFESEGYENAEDRAEITLKSGAGNVIVNVK